MLKWFDKFKKDKKEKKDKEHFEEHIDESESLEEYIQQETEKYESDNIYEEILQEGVEEVEEVEPEEEIEDIPEEKQYEEEIEDSFIVDYEEEPVEEPEPVIKNINFFDRLKSGLTKTRKGMIDKIENILKSYTKIDDELFDDLEEALVTADVGVNTTIELIERLKNTVKQKKVNNPDEIKDLLKDEIKSLMKESGDENKLIVDPSPAVILVVGVNGVGKTTTIGKLSYNYKKQGKKVLLAAGDTFRAAAIEQLEEWSNRAGVEIISHSEGADPAAVIFDGIQAAKARKSDILICDTAGRLHNKSNLMNELNKIFRVVEREYGNATKEVLLVLDATTGQNAINQAKVFKEVANITGVALTKLDGTAKGGVVIALQSELGLPVKLVGVGEAIEDLQDFDPDDFVDAIFN